MTGMSERLTTEGMIAVIDRELFRLRAALTEKHAMSLAHVHLLHRRMMAVAGLRAH
jgi:hypothetical protein